MQDICRGSVGPLPGEEFGSQCIVIAIDAKKVAEGKWEIFTHGGRKATGIDSL